MIGKWLINWNSLFNCVSIVFAHVNSYIWTSLIINDDDWPDNNLFYVVVELCFLQRISQIKSTINLPQCFLKSFFHILIINGFNYFYFNNYSRLCFLIRQQININSPITWTQFKRNFMSRVKGSGVPHRNNYLKNSFVL